MAPDIPRDTCYFDGQCGMCRRSVLWLRRLDWLNRLEFTDMNSAADLPVDISLAMQGMPMRTRQGKIHVGFPAVRRALLQTPLGFLPAIFLYIPGLSHLAAKVYNHIARNRRRTVSCQLSPQSPSPARPD